MRSYFNGVILVLLISCQSNLSITETENLSPMNGASITVVTCKGQPNNYTLNVTIASPDTGCDQYADWWEVLTSEGNLVYRRILAHSHVNEQPFTRSGGPVDIGPDEELIVRAHMNNLGYGIQVFRGTLRNDLVQDTLSADFAIELETTEPLPNDCAF